MTINMQLSWNTIYMHIMIAKAQPILKPCYLGTLWTCPRTPDHAHLKFENKYTALMDIYFYANNQNNSSSHFLDNEDCVFGTVWVCLSMPDHGHPKYEN